MKKLKYLHSTEVFTFSLCECFTTEKNKINYKSKCKQIAMMQNKKAKKIKKKLICKHINQSTSNNAEISANKQQIDICSKIIFA